jgi:uncharacterized protein
LAPAKETPANVVKAPFKAKLNGEVYVVTGRMNKLQTAIANITPAGMLAERHHRQVERGSARL